MIYVDRAFAPPLIFSSPEMERARQHIREFYEKDSSSRSQQRFSNLLDKKFRNEFLPALRDDFKGKCAYCESNINLAVVHSEYDHFRPKHSARGFEGEASDDHYWWLVYEWRNIYYCCTKCNMYKSTWFPVDGPRLPVNSSFEYLSQHEVNLLVDPCSNEPSDHFEYDMSGVMIGITQEGVTTIEIIKLNRVELVEQRRSELNRLESSFKIFETFLSQNPIDVAQMNIFFDDWRDIFSDHSLKPYLGIQRYFLREWLKKYDLHDYLVNRDFIMPTDEELEKHRNWELNSPKVIDFDMSEPSNPEIKEKLEGLKHIFIEKLELHNFRCFSDFSIQFNTEDSVNKFSNGSDAQANEPWILFLGENGVGKSSLLKAFAIGLAGREYIETLELRGSDLLKHGEKSGYIKLHLVGGIAPATVEFTNTDITCNIHQPIINFVAYNAVRLKQQLPYLLPEKNKYFGAKAKNLFDYTATLIDCDHWLSIQVQEDFDRIGLTLKDLMSLDNDEYIILVDGRAAVRHGEKILYIDDLSDGYQSIFYMAIDIMATIQLEGVPYELAEGMIIIDEIGAHLHPRWRMEVVGKLRRAFPKMRFVVSTHEPLCLRGINLGETVVLQKDQEGSVFAQTDLPDPSELRIDQILTSDFFGLHSTMDSETERNFQEYYELLSREEIELSKEEFARLSELKNLIPKIRHLGDSLRESIIYGVVDKLLADKKSKTSFKNIEEIKQEAFKRLQKIWDIN